MTPSKGTVRILVYRWAGRWGPFSIKIPCGECALTTDVITDTMAHELEGIPINLELTDWLSHWFKPLINGGWHAPIVMVNGAVVNQGRALNRGVLTEAVITAFAQLTPVQGNHLFGKLSCPHCERAKDYLKQANIDYRYHNVVRSPRALYEMLARVKPLIGSRTPITVPQIWIEGQYVGGADELQTIVKTKVVPNLERGQCSLSAQPAQASNAHGARKKS